MGRTYQKGIAIFDLHFPEHNKALFENIIRVIKTEQPTIFIFGGDNLTMVALDHWRHEKGQKRQLEGKRLIQEYKDFQLQVLDRLEKALPDNCRKIWLYGNHCDWVEQYIDRHPEVEGMLEIENNLRLESWEKYKYGQIAKTGKIGWIHGNYTNDAHAKKTVHTYFSNIAYGHTHDHQVYTKTTPSNQQSHIAVSMPCACNLDPHYIKTKVNKWVEGFGMFYIQSNGLFNLYPVISVKGHFVWNGKYY